MKSPLIALALWLVFPVAFADPAADVITKLKAAALPIGKMVVYTEDSDPNDQLGRPYGYTAKANWADKSIKQDGIDMIGGTVEVFASAADLERRREYIEAIGKSMPMFGQYIYAHGLALMRLDRQITPSKARLYEAAFKK